MNHIGNALNIFGNQDVSATTASTSTSSTTKAGQASNGASSMAAAFTGDQAQLSTASTLIAPSAGSDVRTDKVAALQAQIAAGTYNVSSSDVADKLIDALLK